VLAHPAHPYTRRLLSAVPVPDPARRYRPRAALPTAPEPPALLLPVGHTPRRGRMTEVTPGHLVAADTDSAFHFAAALVDGRPGAPLADSLPAAEVQDHRNKNPVT